MFKKPVYLCALFIILTTMNLSAQDVQTQNSGKETLHTLSVYTGYHKHIYGYEDYRYVASDKGDYISALAGYAGVEYERKGLKGIDPQWEDNIMLGGNLNFYMQDKFSQKTLYAVPSLDIEEELIPKNQDDRESRFQLSFGFFVGYDNDWAALAGGLTAKLSGYDETVRLKYAPDGSIVDSDGRGWVWDDSILLPNFYFRFGWVEYPHLVLELYRENYDPGYGSLQGKLNIPASKNVHIAIGGSFWETSSVFLEPSLHFDAWSIAIRAGTVINYYDDDLSRVGVLEGFYSSLCAGFTL